MNVALYIHWDEEHTSPPCLFKNITQARRTATQFRKIYRSAGLKPPRISMLYTRDGRQILGWARSHTQEEKQ